MHAMQREEPIVDVTAAILFRQGRILIARRGAGQRLAGKWEFVGGKLEKGETPEEGLRRELFEELGLDARVGSFFGESIYKYDHLNVRLLAYVAHADQGEIRLRDHDQYRLLEVRELVDYDFAPADLPFVKRLQEEGIDGLAES